MLLIFYVLNLFAISSADIDVIGSCPKIKSNNFDFNKVIGNWKQWAHIPNVLEEPKRVCVEANFYSDDDGVIVAHVDETIRITGAWYTNEIKSTPTNTTGIYTANLLYYGNWTTGRLTFVDADWNHWMITHACTEDSGRSQQVVWIWTKRTHLYRNEISKIAEVLRKINIPLKMFEKTDNTRCPKNRPFRKLSDWEKLI